MAKARWEPRSYPIRDPRTTTQETGRVVNPPRGLKLGGRGEKALLRVKPSPLRVSDRGKGGRS